MFIVLEAKWQEKGVLLVFKTKADAIGHGCEHADAVIECDRRELGDLGEVCVFRCELKRAMQIVVSTDPDRALPRTEYNEMLEETLGHGDTGEGDARRQRNHQGE